MLLYISFFFHRPQTTIENLTKLPSIFKKDGVVSAGNASVSFFFNITVKFINKHFINKFNWIIKGICDGAASVLVASEEAVREFNLKPLARLVAYSTVGVPPEIMGIGPVPAIENVLNVSGLKLNDIDLIEVR